MDLSIIIINWNTKQLLRECVESVYKTTKNINFEIIVVDNASSDGSVEMVKKEFDKVILIENDVNMGFAKANNVGFPLAVGRYVLLLNSDTVVQPDALDSAVKFLDINKEVGALTPKIFNADGTIQHPGYLKEPSLTAEIYDAFELRKIFKIERSDTRPAEDDVYEVAHACGCSLFIRNEALDKVGYLDDQMIFSFEDADICIRIRRAGWHILYFPDSHIIHFGGASRGKHNSRAVNAMLQSKYVFFRKYHNGLYVTTLATCLVFSAIIKVLVMSILMIRSNMRSQQLSSLKYYWSIVMWHLRFIGSDSKGMSNKL
jgi:hypothetical protein